MKRNNPSASPDLLTGKTRQRSRYWFGCLALLCFCPTCKQAASTDTPAPEPSAPAPSVATAAPEAESATAPQAGSACAGKYQGEYIVSAVKPELTRKQGAPEQWEKDDGTTLTGKGTLTLQVDSNNTVSGSAEGALGQLTLRGACDENTLRVQMDSSADELSKIRNAYLVADVSGSDASGTLAAATGDSLIRRAGTVKLQRVP